MILDKLLIFSVVGIALDEFNLPLGLLSVKVSLITALISVLLSGHAIWLRDRYLLFALGVFVTLHLFTLLNVSVGLSEVAHSRDVDTGNPFSRMMGLVIFILWAQLLSRRLNIDQVLVAFKGLFILMLLKSVYISYLYYSGEIEDLWWFSGGFPRLSLKRGGMTANQTGAIWLVLFIVLTILTFEYRSISARLYWFVIMPLVIFFGSMSGSRSFMIGVAVLTIGLTLTRRRFGIFIIFLAVLAGFSYIFLDSDFVRLDDESTLSRIDFWKSSLQNINQNPIFGTGLGSDSAPHNTLLQLLSETGILGTLAFVSLMALFFYRAVLINFRIFSLMITPYLFFLMVDIGLMQWQTWALFGATYALARSTNKIPEPCISLRTEHKYAH